MTTDELTPDEIAHALKIAGELIDAGIPVFAAAPDSARPGEYHLPKAWEMTVCDRRVLERWRPGWALGAVGGHVADFLDNDPRNGGQESMKEVRLTGHMPRYFGRQATPSGGEHYVISATGERKATNFMPGLDLQSGGPADEHGKNGRGFVYISPTVRPSKAAESMGQLRPYRWEEAPDIELLREFAGSDDSTEGIIARIYSARGASRDAARDVFATPSAVPLGGSRSFTVEQYQAHARPALQALAAAPIGQIEHRANEAAIVLSHFVPTFLSVERGMELLQQQLAHTAYDGKTWRVEKFRAVLDGRRPPADNWKAEVALAPQAPDVALAAAVATAPLDAVDALLAEMITPEEIALRPPPRPLVRGLLNLDSESWIIGEPGSKKSFVAQDIAGHVARGQQWQGLKVTRAGVVMIVAEGAGGMSSRIKAWEQEYGPMGDTVRILPRPVQARDVGAWAVLVKACARLAPGLIVVDTQARVTVGLEENSATEMGVYVEAVRALREATGACVLTVHHTGRKGGDARGSSAIDGAQHTELKVESKGLSGQLRTEKQKDMEALPPMPLRFKVLTVGVDEDGADVTSLVLEADAWKLAQEDCESTETPGQEVRVSEPEAWTEVLFEHNKQDVQRRILQVIRELAGQSGRTEAKIQKSVAERWYGGKVGRVAGTLNSQTWNGKWTAVLAASWSEGRVVVPGEVGGWIISPDYLETLSRD